MISFWGKNGLRLVFFALFVVFAFWLANLARENLVIQETISAYGYFGIFVVSLISGFNLAVPVPAISFLPLFVESGLNIWLTIVIIVLGTTIADLASYFLGRAGKYLTKSHLEESIRHRLERWREKYSLAPILVLFLFAALVPLPNEILAIPLGFMGYRVSWMIMPLVLGNTVFNLLAAFGILNLFSGFF